MSVNHLRIYVNTGTDGAGTATLSHHENGGKLLAIGISYHASIDAGTDVTVSVSNSVGPAQTLLTVSNSKTDGWFYPRAAAVLPANSAITNSFVEIPFAGRPSAAVTGAGGTALAPGVTVDIFYED